MIGDLIKSIRRKNMLAKIVQEYADSAVGFRSTYSALICSAYSNEEMLKRNDISIELIRKIFEKVNSQVNNHFEMIEDLIIKQGMSAEEAIKKVGMLSDTIISIDEMEREIENGK